MAALRTVWTVATLETAVVIPQRDFGGGKYHAVWDGSKEVRQRSYKGLVACKICFSGFFFLQGDESAQR